MALFTRHRREQHFESLLLHVRTEPGKRTAIRMAVEKGITVKPEYSRIAQEERTRINTLPIPKEDLDALTAAFREGGVRELVDAHIRVRDFHEAVEIAWEATSLVMVAQVQEAQGRFDLAARNYETWDKAIRGTEHAEYVVKLRELDDLLR